MMGAMPADLPQRTGPRPTTTDTNPHTQLDQQPTDPAIVEELARRLFALPGVVEEPSRISVPGARAATLGDGEPTGPPEAFLVGREFTHLHPAPDHSLHAMLPLDVADAAVAAGWAEVHPVARTGLIPRTAVMLYAPRDAGELDVVDTLIRASHAFARPQPQDRVELTLRPKQDVRPLDRRTAERIAKVAHAETVDVGAEGAVFGFAAAPEERAVVRGNVELAARFELGAHWHTRYELLDS